MTDLVSSAREGPGIADAILGPHRKATLDQSVKRAQVRARRIIGLNDIVPVVGRSLLEAMMMMTMSDGDASKQAKNLRGAAKNVESRLRMCTNGIISRVFSYTLVPNL